MPLKHSTCEELALHIYGRVIHHIGLEKLKNGNVRELNFGSVTNSQCRCISFLSLLSVSMELKCLSYNAQIVVDIALG